MKLVKFTVPVLMLLAGTFAKAGGQLTPYGRDQLRRMNENTRRRERMEARANQNHVRHCENGKLMAFQVEGVFAFCGGEVYGPLDKDSLIYAQGVKMGEATPLNVVIRPNGTTALTDPRY